MKTITKEIKLYRYNELSKEAKDEAKASYLNINRFQSHFDKSIRSSLENEGVRVVEHMVIRWSLIYSLSDYLQILGDIYFEDLSDGLKNRFFKGLSSEELKFFKQFEKYSKICFRELGACSGCVGIRVPLSTTSKELYDLWLGNDFKFEDKRKYYKISPKIEKNIEEWYDEICEEYKEFGYKYFYEADEDEVAEYYEDTEQLFLENGDLYEE